MYRDAFVDEMENRFADYLSSDDPETVEGAQCLIYGCSQYHIEEEAMAFLEKNPHPTGKELARFFDETAPDGLSPEDDGEDLEDVEEPT